MPVGSSSALEVTFNPFKSHGRFTLVTVLIMSSSSIILPRMNDSKFGATAGPENLRKFGRNLRFGGGIMSRLEAPSEDVASPGSAESIWGAGNSVSMEGKSCRQRPAVRPLTFQGRDIGARIDEEWKGMVSDRREDRGEGI